MTIKSPDPSLVPPPDASASWNLRSQVILCYMLFLLGWISGGLTALIAVIIAFVKRGDAKGTAWHSHFQNLIAVFFAMLALFLIAAFSWPLALGALFADGFVWPFQAVVSFQILLWMLVFPLFALWYLYRIVKGLLRALDDRAY